MLSPLSVHRERFIGQAQPLPEQNDFGRVGRGVVVKRSEVAGRPHDPLFESAFWPVLLLKMSIFHRRHGLAPYFLTGTDQAANLSDLAHDAAGGFATPNWQRVQSGFPEVNVLFGVVVSAKGRGGASCWRCHAAHPKELLPSRKGHPH
jgi:hypothetical protein